MIKTWSSEVRSARELPGCVTLEMYFTCDRGNNTCFTDGWALGLYKPVAAGAQPDTWESTHAAVMVPVTNRTYRLSGPRCCPPWANRQSPEGSSGSGALEAPSTPAQPSQTSPSPTQTLTLSDLKPSRGPMSGGTQVTITGTNLNAGSNVVVMFGTQPCLFHR